MTTGKLSQIAALLLLAGLGRAAWAGSTDDVGQPYSRENCPRRLVPVEQRVSCQRVADESDGTLVYRFYFGKKSRFLLEFTRWAAVLPEPRSSRLAINDFEGPGVVGTDCHVFLDANHPGQRLSVARAWAIRRSYVPKKYAHAVNNADESYFTCHAWAGNRVRVQASYRYFGTSNLRTGQSVGGLELEGTAWLSMDGRLGGIAYTPD